MSSSDISEMNSEPEVHFLNRKKLPELRKIAKEAGVKRVSNVRKQELIGRIVSTGNFKLDKDEIPDEDELSPEDLLISEEDLFSFEDDELEEEKKTSDSDSESKPKPVQKPDLFSKKEAVPKQKKEDTSAKAGTKPRKKRGRPKKVNVSDFTEKVESEQKVESEHNDATSKKGVRESSTTGKKDHLKKEYLFIKMMIGRFFLGISICSGGLRECRSWRPCEPGRYQSRNQRRHRNR